MPWAINGKVSTDPLQGGIFITNEQYAEAIDGILEGKLVSIDGGFSVASPHDDEPGVPPAPSLAEAKALAKVVIDNTAENSRRKYITTGSGQAMTYMQKADEARRFLAASQPVEADYPLLAAEIGITAPDMIGVAQIVIAAFTQWQAVGAAIEGLRLGGKAAVDAAPGNDEVWAIVNAIAWP